MCIDFKIVKSSEYKRNYFSRKKYITHKMKTKILSHPQKRSTIHLTISFHLYLSFFWSHFEIIKNTLEGTIVFLRKSQCQLKSVFLFYQFSSPNNCFLIYFSPLLYFSIKIHLFYKTILANRMDILCPTFFIA